MRLSNCIGLSLLVLCAIWTMGCGSEAGPNRGKVRARVATVLHNVCSMAAAELLQDNSRADQQIVWQEELRSEQVNLDSLGIVILRAWASKEASWDPSSEDKVVLLVEWQADGQTEYSCYYFPGQYTRHSLTVPFQLDEFGMIVWDNTVLSND